MKVNKSTKSIIDNARKNGYIWPYEIKYLEGCGLSKKELMLLNENKRKYKSNNVNLYSYKCQEKGIYDDTMYLDYKFKYKLKTDTHIEPYHLVNLLDGNTSSFYSIVRDYNKNILVRFESQEDYLLAKLSNMYGQTKGFIENEDESN